MRRAVRSDAFANVHQLDCAHSGSLDLAGAVDHCIVILISFTGEGLVGYVAIKGRADTISAVSDASFVDLLNHLALNEYGLSISDGNVRFVGDSLL
jgi:hypothetical protein